MEGKVKITQVRSSARCLVNQIRTLEALGLRGIRKSVVRANTPVIKGMLNKVSHLVEVEDVK